jgi:hypothetical protein
LRGHNGHTHTVAQGLGKTAGQGLGHTDGHTQMDTHRWTQSRLLSHSMRLTHRAS